jgi:hypothetical protein
MISIQKIDRTNYLSVIRDMGIGSSGAVFVRARETDLICGVMVGEMGMVRYSARDKWEIVFQGGHVEGPYNTCSDLFRSCMIGDRYSFFHIEIKP